MVGKSETFAPVLCESDDKKSASRRSKAYL